MLGLLLAIAIAPPNLTSLIDCRHQDCDLFFEEVRPWVLWDFRGRSGFWESGSPLDRGSDPPKSPIPPPSAPPFLREAGGLWLIVLLLR